MKHFTFTYDEKKRSLVIYHNDKFYGGMIGKIAEERYKAITAEIEKIDQFMNHAKALINGANKTKTPKV